MIHKLLIGGIVLGAVAAAGGAEAATQVVTKPFDLTSSSTSLPFTLVAAPGISQSAQFNTALGTLTSIEIDWSDIVLTVNGKTNNLVGGTLGGYVTGAVVADGVNIGKISTSVGTDGAFGWNKPLTAIATSSGLDKTFTSGKIFDDAAAGDTLAFDWNTGKVAGAEVFSLQFFTNLINGSSNIGYLGAGPLSAELAGKLVVTYTYSPVPEASTWAMMGLGFAGLGFAGYRSRRAAASAVA